MKIIFHCYTLILQYYDGNGEDSGVSNGVGPVTAMLTCNDDGQWIMDGFTEVISTAECVAVV